jgi:hypothetical protein
MKPSLIDVPVLLIFMARHKQFVEVFNQVKTARPSKLFLYQDGPRENKIDDLDNILKCRAIAEDIDWECEVYRMYQEKNIGCDPSEYIAQKWMFSFVEKGIILEDDDVPSQSFFPFCNELLDRYLNDKRINYICGMNHLGIYENGTTDSYFFTSTGSIWGWATWKRTIDSWEEDLDFLNDRHSLNLLKASLGKRYFKKLLPIWKLHRDSGKAYYESIHASSFFLNSQLAIVPIMNLISNIGIAPDSTHAVDSLSKLPERIRGMFFMRTYELKFPLEHPKYITNDIEYRNKVNQIMGNSNSLIMNYMNKAINVYYKLLKRLEKLRKQNIC